KPSRRPGTAAEARDRLAHILSNVQRFGIVRRPFSAWRGKRGRRKLVACLVLLSAALITTEVAIRFADLGRGTAPAKPPETQASASDKPTEAYAADSLVGGETEFFSNFETATQSLNSAGRKSVFIRSGDDPWHREIESLDRDLKRIESNNH